MASSNIIGIPTDESEFEEKCVTLFACICGDPNFKRIATKGKKQGGLDLIGTRNQDPEIAIGVQCKLVTKGAKLDVNKVTSDIKRALQFTPALAEIYVVTTASDDIEYDQLTLGLRQAQKATGRSVDIQIWGWDTLQGQIRRYPEARNAFDPDYSASTNILLDASVELRATAKETRSAIAAMDSEQSEVSVKVSEIHAAIVDGDPIARIEIEALLDRQVDGFRDLLNNGKPNTARSLLEAFEISLPASASSAIRSRVKANIGFAKLKLGDDHGCATALREAFEINPGDQKAQANSLLADILEGHPETALSQAKTMLLKTPPNELAASYVYQAAAMMDADTDADGIVPPEFRVEENAGVNRLLYLRKHRSEAWWAAAEELGEKLSGNSIASRFAAEAKLERALRNVQLPVTVEAGADRQAMLSEAASGLQDHWEKVRYYENASQDVWLTVAINLSTAYRALRQFDLADATIKQALAIDPTNEEALIASAHIDLILDRATAALAKTETLPDTSSRTIILASVYGELDRWDDVVGLVTPERLQTIGPDDRPLVDAILVRAKLEVLQPTDAKPLIADLISRWPNDNRIQIAAADLAYRKAPEGAGELLQTAVTNLTPQSRFADRIMVAECALRHNEFALVIEALDGFIEMEKASDPLAWLALAFVNSPLRPRTAEFFAQLGPDVISTPRFARLAGCLDCNRGQLHSAERHLRTAIAGDPTDLRSLLMLQSALERAGKREAAKKLVIAADEQQLDGDPRDRMQLAMLLGHYGQTDRALILGYAVASNNRNNERIVCMYPGIVFLSKAPLPFIKRGGRVDADDWFSIKSADGDKIEGLITSEATPETQTFNPENTFAKLLIGSSQGQTVSIEQPFGKPKEYTIEEVKCKYLWLFDDITRSHATRFPGSASMGTMTMQDGDIQPVLDVVRASVEYDRSILEFYQQHPVPIEMLAAIHKKSPIGISELILHYGGEIDTCFGSNEERETASQCIMQAAGKGAVVDTLTAWCLLHFDLLDVFKEHFGRLAIAQSTIDDLLEMRGREEWNLEQEYMTLGYEGDQAVRQIHSPAETKERTEAFDEAISKLRATCDILPIDGIEDIELATLVHRDTIEQSLHAMQIAKHHSLFLLSEDFRLRQMNDVYGSKRSGWIQVAAQVLTGRETLSAQQYARVVGQLAARKHGYISVNGQTLVDVLCMDIPQADAYFDRVAEYIGGPKAEIFSHVSAVSDFMSQVWITSIPSWRKGRACGKLIDCLIRHRGSAWPSILAILDRSLENRRIDADGRPDLGRSYLRDWITGHFLWPTMNEYAASMPRKGKAKKPKRPR